MRLWSIHPKYLDAKGLVALWREALLAQKVLFGKTAGYRNNPQLIRFKESSRPTSTISQYLRSVYLEAVERRYNFDKSKIANSEFDSTLQVTDGQLRYEFQHLLGKLETRDPARHESLKGLDRIDTHPLFDVVDGDVADWEVR